MTDKTFDNKKAEKQTLKSEKEMVVKEAEIKEAKSEAKKAEKEEVYSVCCNFRVNSRKPHKFLTGEIYPESLLNEILYEVDLKNLLVLKFIKKEK